MPPSERTQARPATGLRLRKKLQTHAAIQRHALDLFRENGYTATTMEQIAAAADISASTLYRYFRTKEDLIMTDSFDPLLESAFRAQPPELPPLEALRGAARSVLSMVPPDELEQMQERAQLSFSIPEVRAKTLDHMVETLDMLSALFAERAGRPSNDFDAQILAGTVIGAILAAQIRWAAEPHRDLLELIEQALDNLIAGPTVLDKPNQPTPDQASPARPSGT